MNKNQFKKNYLAKISSDTFSIIPEVNNDSLLQVELTNCCNHKCFFCPNTSSSRHNSIIDKELAYRVIKESFDLGVRKLALHMNGEPFVCDFLEEIIYYAKNLGYTYVFFSTNGALATDERLKKAFDAGLDSIKFSINAGTQQSYLEIHGRDDFEKAINALKSLWGYFFE